MKSLAESQAHLAGSATNEVEEKVNKALIDEFENCKKAKSLNQILLQTKPIVKFLQIDKNIKSKKRTNWEKSTSEAKERFAGSLSDKLDLLKVPACVQCRDSHCSVHTEQIEDYAMSLLEAVESAAQDCLAYSGGGKQGTGHAKVVPGWSEYVKPYSEESKFWAATWRSASKPRAGALFQAMQHSKQQYKYAIRRLKRANNKT